MERVVRVKAEVLTAEAFAPFGELGTWVTELSPEVVAVPDFDQDCGADSVPSFRRSEPTVDGL